MRPMRVAVYRSLRVFVPLLLTAFPFTRADPNISIHRVTVGAIRWDAWNGQGVAGKAVEKSLGPAKWHNRLPFFAKVFSATKVSINGASQQVMDQEIRFAADSGLNYWAFVSYAPSDPSSLALHYYLSSKLRQRLRFCMIFEYSAWGKPGDYKTTLQRYAYQLTETGYQKVFGNRPLVFLELGGEGTAQAWGGFDAFRKSVEYFRTICRQNGAGNPYIVVQQWNPEQLATIQRQINADAVSAYSIKRDEAKAAPYSSLAASAREFWIRCWSTQTPVVPIVMTGWDRRPRVEHPVPWESWQRPDIGIDNFYETPTPAQLAGHLKEAIVWIDQNPGADPANLVLIYAWNENDEGGWLVPTLSAGSARLNAIKKVLTNNP